MSRFVLAALVGGFTLVSCASELKQRPASLDPSNPDAPEASPLPVSTALQPEASRQDEQEPAMGVAAPDHAAHSVGQHLSTTATPDGGASVFTCPMHPEVTQSEPGRCPKCGMNLVPQRDVVPPARVERSERPDSGQSAASPSERPTTYTCPMHPEVSASKPGRCPKCGMELVPGKPKKPGKNKSAKPKPEEHHGHDHGAQP